MQKLALIALGVAVVGEGAYLVKLNRNVTDLTARLAEPAAAAAGSAAPGNTGVGHPAAAPDPTRPGPRAAVPVFATTTPASAPVLDTLASPEGRQRLTEVLAAMKEERRRDKLVQSTDKRLRSGQRLKETIGAELALTPEETRKSEDVLGRLGEQRRHLLEELQTGARTRADVKKDLDAAGRAADASMQEILGEKRMTAFRDLRRKLDRTSDTPPAEAARAVR